MMAAVVLGTIDSYVDKAMFNITYYFNIENCAVNASKQD